MATGIVQLLIDVIGNETPDSWAYGCAMDVLWTVTVYGGGAVEQYLFETRTLPT